jgi:hypothetical protein
MRKVKTEVDVLARDTQHVTNPHPCLVKYDEMCSMSVPGKASKRLNLSMGDPNTSGIASFRKFRCAWERGKIPGMVPVYGNYIGGAKGMASKIFPIQDLFWTSTFLLGGKDIIARVRASQSCSTAVKTRSTSVSMEVSSIESICSAKNSTESTDLRRHLNTHSLAKCRDAR